MSNDFFDKLKQKVFEAIPDWEEKESGVTIDEISNKIGSDKNIVRGFLNNLRGRVETISCGDNPVRYRKCKQF
ncbi:TPA: hypothetical protein DCZ46_00455 [Candidatus Campbellbacteria bacterium]|jgi:hypothetical protein|nr:MAG: hypothetical protein UR58_C0001G0080 [Candidatus Campbellbacteria bacterium GW2011_OD1_34_28]KKP75439.1 MAG: hypothetical protein UR74_C0001G0295 [Candidatus Campbellbacteria bacterium GW2011_GWD2_35_24]KKP76000.1 MAG: hypothetical protein UR75_C0001G0034 [Candidatus Campbellbacteria bacterium GW2011_GWC2_35_28]KKP77189.1 MAG: hypothetical protein UR76_C0001G0034 [Candidatus Campbellbacteria bacterium GW2011_GWC1_35_31]KKP79118.1 MAG: hypothetical protein UR79_C0001G0034 [Candidatus Cam